MTTTPTPVAPVGGRGSAGNVIAAICSLLIPGLGQLVQGRFLKALWHFILAGVVWVITLTWGGWIVHLWSCYEAAVHKPEP
jgi:TM2 domain-containing membrane protein YozV